MLCFHVNQARLMVSAGNFMKVLFLTYDVRSYGILQSLHPDGGLNLSPVPLHACSEVSMRQRGPFHQVRRHRCKHGLDRHTSAPSRSCPESTSPHSSLKSNCCRQHVNFGCAYTTDNVASTFVVLCAPLAVKFPNYRTTFGRSYNGLLIIHGRNSNAQLKVA
jgi:hypothetical protein